MRKFLKRLTRPLWLNELQRLNELEIANGYLNGDNAHLERELMGLGQHLQITKEMFREKQEKITRLQRSYSEKTRPCHEDMRKEQLLGDSTNLLSLAQTAPERLSRMVRGNFKGTPSDGTVQGVPNDRPNEPVGTGWAQ